MVDCFSDHESVERAGGTGTQDCDAVADDLHGRAFIQADTHSAGRLSTEHLDEVLHPRLAGLGMERVEVRAPHRVQHSEAADLDVIPGFAGLQLLGQ